MRDVVTIFSFSAVLQLVLRSPSLLKTNLCFERSFEYTYCVEEKKLFYML